MAVLTPISVGDATTPSNWDSATNGTLGDNNDGTYGEVTNNADGNYTQGWQLDDPTTADTDFGTMDDLACVVRYGWSATPTNTVWENPSAGGTEGITVYITTSDAATQLAGASSSLADGEEIVAAPTAETPTNSSSVGFTYVNTTATAAQWDGAIVVITIGRNRSKGGGSEGQRIYEVDFTGNYSIASTPGTATPGVIASSVTFLAPTLVGPAVEVTSAMTTVFNMPAVTAIGGTGVNPGVIAMTANFQAPTLVGGAVIVPGVMSLPFTMPAATPVAPLSITSSVIATTFNILGVTPVGAARAAPGVIGMTLNMPSSTAVGGAVLLPGVITSSINFPSPTLVGPASLTTSTMALAFTIPQATAVSGEGATPGSVTPAVIAMVVVVNPVRRVGGTLVDYQGTSLQSHWDALGEDLKAMGMESGEIVGMLNEWNDTVGIGYWEARKQALGIPDD
jgi:hypothetical protein